MTREPGTGAWEPVTAAFQAYADRGVFRGFRAAPARRGRVVYEFKWLTKKPVRAEFDAATHTLRFPALLPDLGKTAADEMAALIEARSKRGIPEHKRLDGRRARLASVVRTGTLSLTATVRGRNHDYAVRTALNVINEMFVTLHERHPEYLVEQFGISAE